MARTRRTSDAAPGDRRTSDDDLCCCGPAIHAYGRVEAQTRALGAQVDLTQTVALQAIANAVLSAQQPAAVANGVGQTSLELFYEKPRDSVILTTAYEVCFSVESQCGPCIVEIWMSGEASARYECLPDSGSVTVSTVKHFTGDEYFTRSRGSLAVRAVATDCAGRTDELQLILPEP